MRSGGWKSGRDEWIAHSVQWLSTGDGDEEMIKRIESLFMTFLLQQLIRVYQKTLSPDHGWLKVWFPYGACKFRPTCSQYGIEALGEFGVMKGGWMTVKRIFRCHPWSKGGWDPVGK